MEDYKQCLRCTHSYWEYQFEDIVWLTGYWLMFIAIPVFASCKILQAIFPYIILIYLLYHNQLFNVDLFQFVMLFVFIGLQFIVLILGIMVFRIQYWLWHVDAGQSWICLSYSDSKPSTAFLNVMQDWYESKAMIPVIEKYLKIGFGQDVAAIILDYYMNIKLIDNEIMI